VTTTTNPPGRSDRAGARQRQVPIERGHLFEKPPKKMKKTENPPVECDTPFDGRPSVGTGTIALQGKEEKCYEQGKPLTKPLDLGRAPYLRSGKSPHRRGSSGRPAKNVPSEEDRTVNGGQLLE